MNPDHNASREALQRNFYPPALISVFVLFTFAGCPSPAPVESLDGGVGVSLVLSSFSTCTEQILPKTDLSADQVEPVFLPLDVRVNGVSGSEAAKLETVISFEPNDPGACLQSSVIAESGEIESLRCMTNRSAQLTFTGSRRVSDAFYCTGTGRFLVKAKTTLNDDANTVIESNPLEITCLPENIFEQACELVEPIEDMGVDMELDGGDMDMAFELDAEPEPMPPASWALVFSPEQESGFDLSVQGSTAPYPKQASYFFSVIGERGQPIPDVPVKFYLDWPAGANRYQECASRCTELADEDTCERRDECRWEIITPEAPGVDGGVTDMEVTEGATDMEIEPSLGICRPDAQRAGLDDRCADEEERCEANYCLPEEVSSLPLSIEPLNMQTDAEGKVVVSVVTSDDPGIYSVRAVAQFNGREQEAHTPNFTVWHQIPSQDNLSFRCKSPIIAGFFRRYAPDENGGTDALGYINYQRPVSECVFQNADRFTGRVPNVPVFFMSEAGTINQSVLSDEDGRATAMWSVGGRSPANVELAPGEERPSDASANTDHNMRDGLVRIIAFTQGEARFIDFSDAINAEDQLLSGDRVYSPDNDVVPAHPEPYVDMNDNGVWDIGEPYHDTNRNQLWDADVFGRSPSALIDLRCFEQWVKSRIAGTTSDSFDDACSLELTDLTADNPDNLQATVWDSTTVLSVGMPQAQDQEFMATCRGATCSGTPICQDALPGLDLYLAPGGVVDFKFAPRDDNYNCVGVEGVELSANLRGDSDGLLPLSPPIAPADVNAELLGLGVAQQILPEHCYHAEIPTLPTAHDYRFSLGYQPDLMNAPPFTTAQVEVTLKVPTYLVGDGGERTRTLLMSVGLCGAP